VRVDRKTIALERRHRCNNARTLEADAWEGNQLGL
jgi:hypothetical protein